MSQAMYIVEALVVGIALGLQLAVLTSQEAARQAKKKPFHTQWGGR
jgi:uncharacterized membrane-anchored protein YhcB (DUF1043 family)